MRIRNFLYDIGFWKSHSFQIPIISVGNLNVGGTGKSPMIEYLARLLSAKWKVAILSRGYKRNSVGFRIATNADDASTLGDEPFQFFKKLGNHVTVTVCADRVEGVNRILKNDAAIDVILLDDAFQHRRIKPRFSILLTEWSKPFYKDYVLPAGRLREPRSGCLRADVIVVTKCNNLTRDAENTMQKDLSRYDKDIFFTKIDYQLPIPFGDQKQMGKEIVLVSGIANPRPLIEFLSLDHEIKKHFAFADHHAFTQEEIKAIQLESTTSILTTEKDYMRLSSQANLDVLDKNRWFYLPIKTEFLNNGSDFDAKVIQTIEKYSKN